MSNRNDPLHPSTSRTKPQQSSKLKIHPTQSGNCENPRPASLLYERQRQSKSTKIFNIENPEHRNLMNHANIYRQTQSKDRKRFFKELLNKFSQNIQTQDSATYRKKIHLFSKIFDHFRIRPEQKQHFQGILKNISQKQQVLCVNESKIGQKMNLQQRKPQHSFRLKNTAQQNRLKSLKSKQSEVRYNKLYNSPTRISTSYQRKNKAKNEKNDDNDSISQVDCKQLNKMQQTIQFIEKESSKERQRFLDQLQQQVNDAFKSASANKLQRPQRPTNLLPLKRPTLISVVQNKNQTPLDAKLYKFRQFLFMINFSNNLFVPLEVEKYTTPFKVYVGKGNNSNLIKAVVKKRFWLEITNNIKEANLVWTQIKDSTIFKKQQSSNLLLQSSSKAKIQQVSPTKHFVVDLSSSKTKLQPALNNLKKMKSCHPYSSQTNSVILQVQNTQLESQVKYQTRIPEIKSSQLGQIQNKTLIMSKTNQNFLTTTTDNSISRQNQSQMLNRIKKHASKKQGSVSFRKHHVTASKYFKKKQYNPAEKIMSSEHFIKYQSFMKSRVKFKLIELSKNKNFKDRKSIFQRNINSRILKEEQKNSMLVQNHLPVNGILGNKKALFYILEQYCQNTNRNLFDFVPLTFHIKHGLKDDVYKKLLHQIEARKKQKKSNFWIIKPGQFSNRGKGISCTNKIQQIRKRVLACSNSEGQKKPSSQPHSIIIQSYITNPMLYNNRKFDIRTFMLLTSVNGKIKAYWYQEGYVRTSSYVWSLHDIEDRQIHLTNDAVQKASEDYGRFQPGNKLSYRQIERYLQTFEKVKKNDFTLVTLPKMKEIARHCVMASSLFLDPSKLQNNFEIFGFDFMLDSKMKPWLIQINTNPCLQISCALLERLIPNMIENAFRIAVDPLFPPPSNFSANFKYNIAQNALNYNKFDLIFDEQSDGPQIARIYQNTSLSTVLNKIEDVQEDTDIFQEEGQQIDLTQVT